MARPSPVGRCNEIAARGDDVIAKIRFADPGISDVADTTCSLVKQGILSGISIGFEALEVGPKQKDGTKAVTRAELLELSIVAIPALPSAVILERAARLKRARARYLDPPGRQRFDLGHRLLDVEGLKPAAQRRTEAAMLRYHSLHSPLPQPPVWAGSHAATVRAIADYEIARVLAASAWIGRRRSNPVPLTRSERLREAEALRRSY